MTSPMMPAQAISLLDIYTQQIEMRADLRSLKDTLPDHEHRIRGLEVQIPPRLEERLDVLEGQIPPRLEERIGELETTKAKMLGLAAAVGIAASAGGTWLGLILAHH